MVNSSSLLEIRVLEPASISETAPRPAGPSPSMRCCYESHVDVEREALNPHFPTTDARCYRVMGARDPSLEQEGP